jgi:hypothetical protein
VGCVVVSVGMPRTAEACSGGPSGQTQVLPPNGSTDVSTATSIIVLAGLEEPEVTLTANGVPVELGAPGRIDTILPGGGTGWRLSLPDFLSPSTAYELRGAAEWDSYVSDAGEAAVILSQFTTASGYDTLEGTPPKIQSLRLWRVRYPKAEIAARSLRVQRVPRVHRARHGASLHSEYDRGGHALRTEARARDGRRNAIHLVRRQCAVSRARSHRRPVSQLELRLGARARPDETILCVADCGG